MFLCSVQNIAKNFRERASASWTFLIFSQASERELDNVFFSRASELARPLARACLLASFVELALALDMKLALYIKLALYMQLALALQLASLLLL